MTTRNPLTNLIGMFEAPTPALILLGGLGFAILLWLVFRKYHLAVPHGQTGIVEKSSQGYQITFLSPGHYILFPWIKTLVGIISSEIETARGFCQVITKDGYVIQIAWTLDYILEPNTIDQGIHPSTIKLMLTDPTRMVDKFTKLCLQKIVERFPLDILQSGNNQSKVNDQTEQAAVKCLVGYGINVEKFQITTVNKPIQIHIPSERDGLIIKKTGKSKKSTSHMHKSFQGIPSENEDLKVRTDSKHNLIHSANPIGKLVV